MNVETFPPDFATTVVRLIYSDMRVAQQVSEVAGVEVFDSEVLGGKYLSDCVSFSYKALQEYASPISPAIFQYYVEEHASRLKSEDLATQYRSWMYQNQQLLFTPPLDGQFVQDKLFQWVRTQRVKILLKEIAGKVKAGQEVDLSAAANSFLRVSDIVSLSDTETFDFGADIDRTLEYLMNPEHRVVLPTGRPKFDRIMAGGFGKREMTIFMAPTNTGKTTVMSGLAADLVRNQRRVVYISLEQSANLIACKLISSLTGIPPYAYRENAGVLRQWAEFVQAGVGALAVRQFPTRGLTVSMLRAYLKSIEQRWGAPVEAVVLDYGDLMDGPGQDDYSRLKDIFQKIRGLAVSMDFALITATQAGRKSQGSEIVNLEDVSDCIEKANIADVMIALCQTKEEYHNRIMRMYWVKHRTGEKLQQLPFRINFEVAQLTEEEADSAMTSVRQEPDAQQSMNSLLGAYS